MLIRYVKVYMLAFDLTRVMFLFALTFPNKCVNERLHRFDCLSYMIRMLYVAVKDDQRCIILFCFFFGTQTI